jgi:hypothetical protein
MRKRHYTEKNEQESAIERMRRKKEKGCCRNRNNLKVYLSTSFTLFNYFCRILTVTEPNYINAQTRGHFKLHARLPNKSWCIYLYVYGKGKRVE